MGWLALDIGGANLKAADGLDYAESRPFPIWRHPERLEAELAALVCQAPPCERLAVTMTAELADCYATKAEGVRAILHAVEAVALDRPTAIYLTDGRFVDVPVANEAPQLAAASNWHALATFANRFVRQWPALLLDMGSTTIDVIPLSPGGPCTAGTTDHDRLVSGELVYTGVTRTPICAIVRRLRWAGRVCPVASELFATAIDAYTLLGDLPEQPEDTDTADGRPRIRAAAHARIARMICADVDSFSLRDAEVAAADIRDAQLAALLLAAEQVVTRLGEIPKTLIFSGQGEFLLRRLAEKLPWRSAKLSLSEELGPQVSCCAPAHAVAVLAREWAANRNSL